jgi:hypothetical protein
MTDIASDLRNRFDFAVLWFHEKCNWILPCLMKMPSSISPTMRPEPSIFWKLYATIDAIPPSLIKETEDLRDAWPELFETTLVHGCKSSASDFFQPAPRHSSRR